MRVDVTGTRPGYTFGKVRDVKVFLGPYRRDTKIYLVQQRDLSGEFDQVVVLLGWHNRQKASTCGCKPSGRPLVSALADL
jgi:hypothetical protein